MVLTKGDDAALSAFMYFAFHAQRWRSLLYHSQSWRDVDERGKWLRPSVRHAFPNDTLNEIFRVDHPRVRPVEAGTPAFVIASLLTLRQLYCHSDPLLPLADRVCAIELYANRDAHKGALECRLSTVLGVDRDTLCTERDVQ